MQPSLLIATVGAYLVGSLPVADQVSRRYGVDIFAQGTGQPGAANVMRCVGRLAAAGVLAGDLAKGLVAVVLGQLLGVDGALILLPAGAAIGGHWNSVFTGFRGGDGLATLGGVTVALFPTWGVAAMAIAALVAVGGQLMPYTSLFSVVLGYAAMSAFSLAYYDEPAITIGLGALALLVLARASLGHRRRRSTVDWGDEVEGGAGAPEGRAPL